MKYEIIANVVDMPRESSFWLNHGDFQNDLSVATTTITECNEKSSKRKSKCDDEENDIHVKRTGVASWSISYWYRIHEMFLFDLDMPFSPKQSTRWSSVDLNFQ